MKRVLIQDECAPDAEELFNKEFKQLIGMDIKEWINQSTYRTPDDNYTMEWLKDGYILSFSADAPYYDLHKIT